VHAHSHTIKLEDQGIEWQRPSSDYSSLQPSHPGSAVAIPLERPTLSLRQSIVSAIFDGSSLKSGHTSARRGNTRTHSEDSRGTYTTSKDSNPSSSGHSFDPPRPPRPGFEWVWFPEGYWAERPVLGSPISSPRDRNSSIWARRFADESASSYSSQGNFPLVEREWTRPRSDLTDYIKRREQPSDDSSPGNEQPYLRRASSSPAKNLFSKLKRCSPGRSVTTSPPEVKENFFRRALRGSSRNTEKVRSLILYHCCHDLTLNRMISQALRPHLNPYLQLQKKH
jgi:hypothetical protein